MTIEIPLTKGYVAIVDDEDADLAEYKWNATLGHGNVYAQRNDYKDGKIIRLKMHRVILSRKLGRPLLPSEKVDHIHRNGCDNRRSELRIATDAQNNSNQGMRSDNTSGYKGVNWAKQQRKWRAQISVNKKNNHLGYFDTQLEAHRAYCEAATKYRGEFASFGKNSPFKLEEFQQKT